LAGACRGASSKIGDLVAEDGPVKRNTKAVEISGCTFHKA